MVNIDNFEEEIDSKIVDRGFTYYEQDAIVEFEKISDNSFRGCIRGSEYYTAVVSLDMARNIERANCNCPFSYGPYCKHIVAVLYHISDTEAYESDFVKDGPYNLLLAHLKRSKKAELVAIIASIGLAERATLNQLLIEFGEDDEFLGFDEYY